MTTKAVPYIRLCSADDSDWLEYRKSGIGASDIAGAIGESRWKTPLELWAEKRDLLPEPDFSNNSAVWWGSKLEAHLAEFYEYKSGRGVERWAELLRSVERPWQQATPDYAFIDEAGDLIPIQIKFTGESKLKDWIDGPPREVYLQVQQEIDVTGAPYGSYGVGVPDRYERIRFFWGDLERDEEAMEAIRVLGEVFYDHHMTNGIPPEPTHKDSDTLAELYPYSTGETINLPGELMPVARTLENVKTAIKVLEQRKDLASNQIKVVLGNAERGRFEDGTGYSWKSQSRHELKPIPLIVPKEDGALVDAYVYRNEFRVLRRFTK